MNPIKTFTAKVTYTKPESGKVRFVTEVEISLGPVLIATATLGGRYSQTQALNEFRRNPANFEVTAPEALGLVA